MVTSEAAPLVKVGGLADVLGALPKELERLGHDVRLVLPLYGSVKRSDELKPLPQPLHVFLAGSSHSVRVFETKLPGTGVKVYFLEYDEFYGSLDVYETEVTNDRRFTMLNRAAINLCYLLDWAPDVFHVHDWVGSLVPVYLNTTDRKTPLAQAATVLTIHNLQHQGHFGREALEVAHLPKEQVFRSDNMEAYGGVNFLKGGLYNATRITTVSPTYAAEIQRPEFGCGLDHTIRQRSGDLVGIANGIDTDAWNPRTDTRLPSNYSFRNLDGKRVCRTRLQESFGLEVRDDVAIYGFVARLYEQKGIDLLLPVASKLLTEQPVQIVILGAGDPGLEDACNKLMRHFPESCGVKLGYNDALSHLIYAGSDFFLMPSRFEPCGLSQMYAMNYGTPPVARRTGGLIDTIIAYDANRKDGTGFMFEAASPDALLGTMSWTTDILLNHREQYDMVQKNGMKAEFSWRNPAHKYAEVYENAIVARSGKAPTSSTSGDRLPPASPQVANA